MQKLSPLARKETSSPRDDAIELTGAFISAGEAAIVLVGAAIVIGALGASLSLLFRNNRKNEKAAR